MVLQWSMTWGGPYKWPEMNVSQPITTPISGDITLLINGGGRPHKNPPTQELNMANEDL